MDYFHYKWSDFSDSGYSLFGHMVRSYGMETDTLHSAPTAERLRKAQFYVIVSPDIPVKNPNPHYMTEQEADVIAAWVKQGGVLVLHQEGGLGDACGVGSLAHSMAILSLCHEITMAERCGFRHKWP